MKISLQRWQTICILFAAFCLGSGINAQAGSGFSLGDCLQKSDHCFDDFISPITNSVWFEDPRTLTEVRLIAAEHKVTPEAGGGDLQVYAAQIRLALTDRLSLVAAKDGYIVSHNPVIDDGWADVALGLKYNIYRDPCAGQLLSVGFAYAMPVGSSRAIQGKWIDTNGEWQMYVTGGTRLGNYSHWLSSLGLKLPVDQDRQTTMGWWSNHFDVMMTDRFYLLTEFNWYQWYDDGNITPLNNLAGHDFFNLGGTNTDGNQLFSQAVGFKYKPSGNQELGMAFEFPLSDNKDVLDNRLTADWIFRY